MSAAQWIGTYQRSSTVSLEVVVEFTGQKAQKELYADAPDWVAESESDVRVGGVAVTIMDRW
jgi:hypothetical protein